MSREKFILPEATLFSLGATQRLVCAVETSHDLAMLKGAAILYPKVVLNTPSSYFDEICELVFRGLNRKQKEETRRIFQSTDKYAIKTSTYGKISDDLLKLPNANQQAIIKRFLELKKSIESHPVGDPFRGEYPRYDPSPLLMLYLPNRLQLSYYDSFAAGKEINKLLHNLEFNVGEDQEISTGIPNIDKLPWDTVLELRKNTYIDSFREYMFTSVEDPQDLAKKIDKGLWEAMGMNKPSPSGEIIQRVVANLPIPGGVPNPYALYRDIKDGLKQRKMFKKYGWLFFLQEVRTKENEIPE